MERVRISHTSNKFKTEFPNELFGVIKHEEFLKTINILNKYPVYNKLFLLFIFLIFGGFGMIIGGAILKGGKDTDDFFNKTVESNDNRGTTGVALIVIGVATLIVGIVFISSSYYISSSIYKKNINRELSIINEINKERSIVWEFQRLLKKDHYEYTVRISFPRSIQKLDEIPMVDTTQYYPPQIVTISATPMTLNTSPSVTKAKEPVARAKEPYSPQSNNPPNFIPYHHYYGEASSSSSSSNVSPYHPNNSEAVSVPLPQEILDMLEREKDFNKNVEMTSIDK